MSVGKEGGGCGGAGVGKRGGGGSRRRRSRDKRGWVGGEGAMGKSWGLVLGLRGREERGGCGVEGVGKRGARVGDAE